MPLQSQATSAGYSADNLKPHDFKLAWTQEFGTETDPANIGDAFQSGPFAVADAPALVNSRFAELNISTTDPALAQTAPQGRTFLIPSWDTYESPNVAVFGPFLKVIVLYAHFRLNLETLETGLAANQIPNAYLVLGQESLVGHVPLEPFSAVQLTAEYPAPGVRPEDSASIIEFGNGGGVAPTQRETSPAWGNDLYARVLCVADATDPQKESDLQIAVSRNGVAWTELGELELDGQLRRVGLAASGNCIVGLDWARIYNYPAQDVSTIIEPPPPATGGKLFLP